MARSSSTDPLEKFRFLVAWSNDTGSELSVIGRAGFHEVGMPKRNTNKISYREGNDPDISMLSAGLSSTEDVTFTRGLIAAGSDPQNAFYKWMSSVHNPQPGHPGIGSADKTRTTASKFAAKDYKKDVTISILHRDGSVARKYKLYNAFPVAFVPGSDLAAGEDGDKMLESLTLAYEDFQELDVTTNLAVTSSTSL